MIRRGVVALLCFLAALASQPTNVLAVRLSGDEFDNEQENADGTDFFELVDEPTTTNNPGKAKAEVVLPTYRCQTRRRETQTSETEQKQTPTTDKIGDSTKKKNTAEKMAKTEGVKAAAMIGNFTKYHNSQVMLREIKKMKKSCKSPLKTRWLRDDTGSDKMFIAEVGNQDAEKRVLIVAGEHPRELIPSESLFHFVTMVCSVEDYMEMLQDVLFILVPVVNVEGRRQVTDDATCQRYTVDDNGTEIDPNRDASVDWGKGDPEHLKRLGNHPFSSYETRMLKKLAQERQLLAYIDIHSGCRALMTPYSYKEGGSEDFEDQAKLLLKVKNKHCADCSLAVSRFGTYGSAGELLDYMYLTLKIKYATVWEIYVGVMLGEVDVEQCLMKFNPDDGILEKHRDNWAQALVTVGKHIQFHVDPDEKAKGGLVPFVCKEEYTSSTDSKR